MSDDKTDRILAAAEGLVLAQGLRATTMEAIAKAAGVAKPTLYGRFPDKEAVFRAAVVQILGRLREAFNDGLSQPGTLRQRIGHALAAKFTIVHHFLTRSPHALQLMEDHYLHAGEEFDALNQWVIGRISEELARAGHPEPEARARLLLACIDGVKRNAPTSSDLVEQVRFVTERLID
jgi:AcrR family transcriptional regulator